MGGCQKLELTEHLMPSNGPADRRDASTRLPYALMSRIMGNRWSDMEPVSLWLRYYSNVSRGKRKKQNQDEIIPCILEPDEFSSESRKNWARLIQKIYEVEPLACPKCQAQMRIIRIIEEQEVIEKILK